MNNNLSMVILAGGKSSRMGTDKCDLLYKDKTFLEIQIEKGRALGIDDIMVSGYKGKRCEIPVIKDRFQEKGPLGGLEACFRHAKHDKVLVLCVDVPLVPVEALKELIALAEQHEGEPVIVKHGERYEPMMGIFPVTMADEMVQEIENGKGQMFAILRKKGYHLYETTYPDELFQNVNNPEAYQKLKDEEK